MKTAIELGMWKVTTTFGWEYLVNVTGLSAYRDGSIHGKYWVRGEAYGVGTFPFCEITKMEKTS